MVRDFAPWVNPDKNNKFPLRPDTKECQLAATQPEPICQPGVTHKIGDSMDSDFARLLGLHHMAASFGQGLKPEIYARLMRYHTGFAPGVIPLGVTPVSSGSAPDVSDADLDAAGIVRLDAIGAAVRNGTDG